MNWKAGRGSVETAQLLDLVGHIYDASLDPALWISVLEETCRLIGGETASLISHDIAQRNASFHFAWNDNPEYTRLYREKYAGLNPVIVPSIMKSEVGDVSTFLDYIEEHEYRETRIYKEWTRPQGYLDAVQVVLDKSATVYSAVSSIYSERNSPVSDGARRVMQLLAPHFRRAVTIGKVLGLHKVEAAALGDTLDGVAAAVFIVDAARYLIYTNNAAKAALANGTVVSSRDGRLMLADQQAQNELGVRLAHTLASRAGPSTIGASIPVSGEGDGRYVAHVLPLTSGGRRKAVLASSAAAAIFLCEAALHAPHPVEALAKAFSLTPAEMRVLTMIVEVGGVPEVSAVLGVSDLTVRTHLRSIFGKTGVSRQADLVKLVASYMSPFRASAHTK